MVFQDPGASLDPRSASSSDRRAAPRARARLGPQRCGRASRACWTRSVCPTSALDRYPHEFSGGQRQRIGIARALALGARPHLRRRTGLRARCFGAGADPATCSTACSSERGLAFVFISHDLGVVRIFLSARRGDVSRPHRRGRAGRGGFRLAAASLYAAVEGLLARARSDPSRRDDLPGGRTALAGRPAAGMSFPSAMSARRRALSTREAGTTGHLARAARCVPPGRSRDFCRTLGWPRDPGCVSETCTPRGVVTPQHGQVDGRQSNRQTSAARRSRKNDPARTQANILEIATEEFATTDLTERGSTRSPRGHIRPNA